MKKSRVWIGIAISIIALVLAFRQIKPAEVWAALQQLNYWLLAASLVPLLLFLVLRAVRWRLLLYPKTGLSMTNLMAAINIGYMVGNIIPARLGDVARAYIIGDKEEVSRTAAFSTILAEHVLDALCAVSGLFVALPFADVPPWMVRAGIVIGVVAVLAVAAFPVLVWQRVWTLRLLDRVLRAIHWPDNESMARFWSQLTGSRPRLAFLTRLPWIDRERLVGLAGSLIDGLSGITNLRQGPILVLLSVIIWMVIAAFYWLVLLAFEPAQPYVAAMAETSVTALGMVAPTSPGNVGVFEWLSRETMVLFGMTPERALSYGIVAHAIVYVVYTLLGIASMAQQNLSYRDVRKRISTEAEPAP